MGVVKPVYYQGVEVGGIREYSDTCSGGKDATLNCERNNLPTFRRG